MKLLSYRTSTLPAFVFFVFNLTAADLPVRVDPALNGQITDAIKAAHDAGEDARALREFRRLLELYANEPMVRAPLYLAMSDLAEKTGDPKARDYRAMALAIDPDIEKKTEAQKPGPNAPATRGSKMDAFVAGLSVATQTIAQVQQARAAYQQQHPQTSAVAPQTPMQPVQFPAQAFNGTQVAPPQGYQPVGGFQPSVDPAAGQLPSSGPVVIGYDAQNQPIFAPQQQPTMQQPVAPQPQYIQQPMQQPVQQQPQYVQQPMQQPVQQQPLYVQQPMQQPVPQQQQQQQPIPTPNNYNQYPRQSTYVPRAPYQANAGYSRGRTRGAAIAPIRALFDRSAAGDDTRFASPCGVLLEVKEAALIFTSACGTPPLVIPAAQITEIRLNLAIAKEIGAFHIETSAGLYLTLAPENGTREQGTEIVDTLRNELQLTQ